MSSKTAAPATAARSGGALRALLTRPIGRAEEPRAITASELVALEYRRRQVLGLLILAAVILAFTLCRADLHVLFPPGWWRW